MILIIQRATSDNPIRAQEFEECLARNRLGGHFQHIEIVEGRPDLTELFALANKFAGLPVVIANSDIIFDESIALAEGIDAKEFYCLSRWEPNGFCSEAGSNDAWIFRAPCKIIAPFQLGRIGCDGRIVRLARDAGYTVTNPCYTIRILHHHASNIRTYSNSEWVQGEYDAALHGELAMKIKPPRIAVYTVAKNEAQFVERWAESCKEADMRIILDTGSDDDTTAKARAIGITVHSANIKPWRFDDARNTALALLPNDIDFCVSLDMDEILLPGWREEIEKAHTAGATLVVCNYAWTVNASGLPEHVFRAEKIHARFGYRWKHPIHEIITSTGNEQRQDSALWIHHLADNSKPRTQYLPLLEMAARESPECSRTLFYLGREYIFHWQLSDAAPVFKKYLTLSTWPVERAEACLHLAKCEPQRRIEWLSKALSEAPQRREVLCALSQYYTDIHNWEAAWGFAMSALKITKRPTDYLCQPNAWAWLPFDLGAIAAHWLGLKNTAIELGEKALAFIPDDLRLLSNIKFYMAEQRIVFPESNDLLSTKPFDYQNVSPVKMMTSRSLNFSQVGDYVPSSTSILRQENGTYLLNVRYVNYRIQPNGNYPASVDNKLSGDNPVRTRNFALITDSDFRALSPLEEITPDFPILHERHIKGVEDLRLYHDGADVKWIGTSMEYSYDGNIKQVQGCYNLTTKHLTNLVSLKTPHDSSCEKNWIPLGGDEYIYGWHPYRIGKVNGDQLEWLQVQQTPKYFEHMRGSSNVVEYDGSLYTMTHAVVHSTPRKYYHHIVKLNKTTKAVEAYTLPFYFFNNHIEYCLGIEIRNNMLFAIVSQNDMNPTLVQIDMLNFQFIVI